jgi:LmbE family N-acetylglucosaminyl deacetylase
MSTVLVVAPHPDDESIGLGGTLLRRTTEGDEVHVAFLTSGEQGGHGVAPAQEARRREAEAREAAAILGVAETEFWREPDGRLLATARNVARLRALADRLRPDVVYVPHPAEMHPDHRAAYRIARGALNGTDLLLYEVWTPLQEMDEIVDISDHIERKLDAIRAYAGQCAVLRFDDAFRGLARYRGEMFLWPGGEYAEIFRRPAR